MDMHRPSDVLDPLLAHVFERKGELVAHLIAHDLADADPAWLGQRFQPCRYIDSVTVDVATVFDDVADIDPDAELDAAIGRHIGVSRRHLALHLDGTSTAATTLGNSINSPSPVVLTMRPRCSLTFGSPISRRIVLKAASVPSSSAPISRL
jgi:hypothetical protein